MVERGILGIFSSHAFLKGLSERHLITLASAARPITAEPGQLLAREGETARALYLIQSGRAAIETRRPDLGTVRVQEVGRGDVVGWSWIVPPYRWQFDCRVLERVQGLALDAEWLREQCETDHELGYHLLKHLVVVTAGRLAATRQGPAGAPVEELEEAFAP